jgi:hypothetical protein
MHYQETSNSFNKRIKETKDIKERLENELSEVKKNKKYYTEIGCKIKGIYLPLL